MLRADNKYKRNELISQGYRFANMPKQELYQRGGNDNIKMLCMECARGNFELYENYYKNREFTDILDMYKLRATIEYNETPRK